MSTQNSRLSQSQMSKPAHQSMPPTVGFTFPVSLGDKCKQQVCNLEQERNTVPSKFQLTKMKAFSLIIPGTRKTDPNPSATTVSKSKSHNLLLMRLRGNSHGKDSPKKQLAENITKQKKKSKAKSSVKDFNFPNRSSPNSAKLVLPMLSGEKRSASEKLEVKGSAKPPIKKYTDIMTKEQRRERYGSDPKSFVSESSIDMSDILRGESFVYFTEAPRPSSVEEMRNFERLAVHMPPSSKLERYNDTHRIMNKSERESLYLDIAEQENGMEEPDEAEDDRREQTTLDDDDLALYLRE